MRKLATTKKIGLAYRVGLFVCALFLTTGSVFAQQNLIENGDFETGDLSAWSPFVADFAGVSADISASGNAAAITNIAGAGSQSWHIQLNQEFTTEQINALEVGKIYTISFDASSPVDGRLLRLFFGQNADPFTALVFEDFELTTESTTYTFSFVLKETFDTMKLGFEAGLSNDDVTIDNVSMSEGSAFLSNGDFSSGDLNGWSPGQFEGATASFGVADGAAQITNVSITDSPQTWHLQMNQLLTEEQIGSLDAGDNYTISFYASSPVDGRPLKLFFGEDGGGFVALADSIFELTTTPQKYEIVFNLSQTFTSMKLGFEAGTSDADVTIDNIIMNKGGVIETDDGDDEPIDDGPSDPNDPLGDEFIFFVEGANTAVPRVDGFKLQDPIDPERGFVQEIGGGAFFQNGYFWEEEGGIDFTENMNRVDTLFLKVRLNPADFANDTTNFTMGLTLADVTDGTLNDLQFGITWPFPVDMYDNEWHELELPLPKATWAAHDSALNNLDLDGNPLPPEEQYNEAQKRWRYDPGWNAATGDILPGDENFKNVEWENLGRIAISLNNNQSGVIRLDDFWIGSTSTDISVATDAASPASGLAANNIGSDSVTVSWNQGADDVGSFDLFYSGSPISDTNADDVFSLGNFNASDLPEFTHAAFKPHPNLGDGTYHYAVVANNKWGFAPEDAPLSTTSTTIKGKTTAHIFNLNETEQNAIFDMLTAGEINDENLPFSGKQPFKIGEADFAEQSDAYNGLDDVSADVHVAYGSVQEGGETFNTFFFYIEALDDDIRGGPASNPGDMTGTMEYPNDETSVTWVPGPDSDPLLEWNYYLKDQIQIHFGTYFVDNFVTGTTHELRQRGAQPDYYLAFQPFVDAAGDQSPAGMKTRMWLTEPNADPNVEYTTNFYDTEAQLTFTPVYENITDGSGNRIGWRALVAIDAFDLLKVDGDAEFTPPEPNEIELMPFMITLMDKDGEDPDAGNWWEVPSTTFNFPTRAGLGGGQEPNSSNITNLGVAAIAGRDVVTSNDDEGFTSTLPKQFKLGQNYPNPFNPSTTINFQLPSSSDVTLTIYNMLGQQVATLIGNQQMAAGQHSISFDASRLSSGMYIYRIEAGTFTDTKKMMLIK